MTEEYEETQFLYSRLISGNVSLVCDEADLNKFLAIISDNGIKRGGKAISQAKEGSLQKIAIIKQQKAAILKALLRLCKSFISQHNKKSHFPTRKKNTHYPEEMLPPRERDKEESGVLAILRLTFYL